MHNNCDVQYQNLLLNFGIGYEIQIRINFILRILESSAKIRHWLENIKLNYVQTYHDWRKSAIINRSLNVINVIDQVPRKYDLS